MNGSVSFLDVKIFWEKQKFVTSVFIRDMFSGMYINFISSTFDLLYTLNCSFNIPSDFLKFHYEVDKLKIIFLKNA